MMQKELYGNALKSFRREIAGFDTSYVFHNLVATKLFSFSYPSMKLKH